MIKRGRQSSGLSLSTWIYAVSMALVAVTVTASVISTTWVATEQSQDVRSYAAEPIANPPVVTSIKVESKNSTSSSSMVTIDENGEVVTEPTTQPVTFGGFEVTSEEASESTTVGGGIFNISGNTPTGVRIVYVLLGLGVVIGGLAFGLILLVKKLLGT